MSTITTRSGKGSPLTNNEVDNNFTNLNTDKAELSGATFTGEIVANGGIALGDNDKATFGAGDLQIYHDGSHSYIDDVGGTGNLKIRATNLVLQSAIDENYATFVANGAASLFYDNAAKLATTATGIDVTGTATMDGLTVDGGAITTLKAGGFTSNSEAVLELAENRDGSNNLLYGFKFKTDGAGDNNFHLLRHSNSTTGNKALSVGRDTGDIGFYEDTGTTPKMVWDASAESLGIGDLPAFSTPLSIRSDSGSKAITIYEPVGANENWSIGVDVDGDLGFYNSADTTATITFNDSGNVGIGTTSPNYELTVSGGSSNSIQITSTATGTGATDGLRFWNTGTSTAMWNYDNTPTLFGTNNSEAMRIDSSGNLLVGTTDNTVATQASGEGFYYNAGFNMGVARAGGVVAQFNRQTNDGDIVDFRKDGTTVGSIASTFGIDIHVGTGDTRLRFVDENDYIRPANSDGSSRDGLTDLGASGGRFKDLYLSGGLRGDTLTFKNLAGSERMRIDSSGNVGIGRASVAQPSAGATTLAIQGTQTTKAGAIRFYSSDDSVQSYIYTDSASGLSLNTTTSHPIVFRTVNLERMRIDTSGQLLLGRGANVASGAEATRIQFYNTNSAYDIASIRSLVGAGQVNRGELSFAVNNGAGQQERMRIDSSGNLLVGTTSTGIYNTSTNTGVQIDGPNANIAIARSGGRPIDLNRLASDGEIARFSRDGAAVGSIGTAGGGLTIGNGDTGVFFDAGNNNIRPFNLTTNASLDAAIDLGRSATRFKDLYLSGKTYLNTSSGAQLVLQTDSTRAFIGTSTSHDLLLETAGSERMRIDSSGRVGIGTSSPAYPLVVSNGGAQGLEFIVGTTNFIQSYNRSASDYTPLKIEAENIQFGTDNGSERMRIDSSGNLLVGKSGTAFSTNGVELRPNGAIWATVTGQGAASFNIKGTDGVVTDFYKDGSPVGSIGAFTAGTSALFFGSLDTALLANSGNDSIHPWNASTNSNRDNAIDLGNSANRFKDFYLSGGVYLGGTSAANKLDDYEEGSWTPTSSTATLSIYRARYIKIGNQVTIHLNFLVNSSVSSGAFTVTNLPFSSAGNAHETVGSVMSNFVDVGANVFNLNSYIFSGSNEMLFYASNDSTAWESLTNSNVAQNHSFLVTHTYFI